MPVDQYLNNGENIPPRSRVRVVPGSSLALPTPPTTPPSSAPPKPSHLCKIAVVGDAFSGKSALVRKFIHRQYANSIDADGETNVDGDMNDNGNGYYGAASATSNSLGTSLGATTYDGLEPTLAEYHKKDVAIWENRDKSKSKNGDVADIAEQRAVCTRVQLWDMNIHHHFTNQYQENEVESSSVHSASSVLSPGRIPNISPLLPLLKRANGFVIACRCPLPPSYMSQSSDASYASSRASNASCSEWLELDLLEQRIRKWVEFLHDQIISCEEQKKPTVSVLLTCADLVMAGYSPREWMQLSDRMQEVCKACDVDSWKMGTCMDGSRSGIDADYSHKSQSTLLHRMFEQQKQLLEDMEDAIEATFIEIISLHLNRSREL